MSSKSSFKVLTLCSWYPNDNNPTLGNFVQKHADTISNYNATVALAIFPSLMDRKIRMVETKRNSLNEIVVYYPKRQGGLKLLRLFLNFWAHRKAFRIGYKRTLELIGKPDVVHLNIVYPLGIWALWLKMRHRIPYVVTENSSGFHVDSEHAYPKPILQLCKVVLKNASVLMPVSENLKSNLEKLSGEKRFEIVCNVVDENLFRAPAKLSDKPRHLIHISTGVDSIKNLSGMVRVINELSKEYPDLHLDLISDAEITYAKELHLSLGGNDSIDFHSTKTTEEIASMIESSDALLMFSNYENFPCVIAESMMCGKPVISSNVNGIPEHVHGSNGVLVNPRDEKALAMSISGFIEGELVFDQEVIRSYALEHFSYASVGKRFTEIYKSIV